MKVELSEATFRRLQAHAIPLVDTVEDVILRLLEQQGSRPLRPTLGDEAATRSAAAASPRVAPRDVEREPIHLPSLDGFQRVLWEEVIKNLPGEFVLSQVYRHKEPLVRLYPTNQAMEATIRAGLQRLRDAGYIEFTRRGEYRKRA